MRGKWRTCGGTTSIFGVTLYLDMRDLASSTALSRPRPLKSAADEQVSAESDVISVNRCVQGQDVLLLHDGIEHDLVSHGHAHAAAGAETL